MSNEFELVRTVDENGVEEVQVVHKKPLSKPGEKDTSKDDKKGSSK